MRIASARPGRNSRIRSSAPGRDAGAATEAAGTGAAIASWPVHFIISAAEAAETALVVGREAVLRPWRNVDNIAARRSGERGGGDAGEAGVWGREGVVPRSAERHVREALPNRHAQRAKRGRVRDAMRPASGRARARPRPSDEARARPRAAARGGGAGARSAERGANCEPGALEPEESGGRGLGVWAFGARVSIRALWWALSHRFVWRLKDVSAARWCIGRFALSLLSWCPAHLSQCRSGRGRREEGPFRPMNEGKQFGQKSS